MFLTYQAKILEKKPLAPQVYYFKCSMPENTDWTFAAGQYMIFHIPQGEDHAARRQYSIASSPSQKDALEFIIEFVENGVASGFLNKSEVGQIITFQGPAGVFTYRQSEREPIFLATGTGIAPIYSIIKDLLETQKTEKNIYLYWGLKVKDDMYYFDNIKKLAAGHDNFHFKLCLSRESDLGGIFDEGDMEMCTVGHVDKGFEEMVTQSGAQTIGFDYYLCGSKHVVESLREYLAAKAIPKEQVYFEKFTL